MAAGLGVVTPFCSCSAVPLFIGFVQAGVPLGVTFSFLIAAPMVNEVALTLLLRTLRLAHCAALSRSRPVCRDRRRVVHRSAAHGGVSSRTGCATCHAWSRQQTGSTAHARGARSRLDARPCATIVGTGLALRRRAASPSAPSIHGYVPETVMAAIMGRDAWWSVPLAVAARRPDVRQCGRHHSDRAGVAGQGRRARARCWPS